MAGEEVGDRNEKLLYSNGVFEFQNRPKRDSGWTFAYILFILLTVLFGVYGIVNRYLIASSLHVFVKGATLFCN